jgi:hypothetical protein
MAFVQQRGGEVAAVLGQQAGRGGPAAWPRRPRAACRLRGGGADGAGDDRHAFQHHGQQHVVLGLEMVEGRAGLHVHGFGDVADGGRRIALLGEQAAGGAHDLGAAVGFVLRQRAPRSGHGVPLLRGSARRRPWPRRWPAKSWPWRHSFFSASVQRQAPLLVTRQPVGRRQALRERRRSARQRLRRGERFGRRPRRGWPGPWPAPRRRRPRGR